MALEKAGYTQTTGASTVLKTGPAGLFSVTCVVAGTIIVYDNTAASGTILFTKTMAVGDVANWGYHGIAAKLGLTVNSGTGTFNICNT